MPFTLNLHGRIKEYVRPQIMGILNATPDSFYADSRVMDRDVARQRVERLISEGADMIDVGAYSSRPGAADVSPAEEMRRLEAVLEAVRAVSADIPVSVDTFRAEVARKAVTAMGADIINDISGGNLDEGMLQTVLDTHAPYILMHMRGTPATMQQYADYDDVTADVIAELSVAVDRFSLAGVNDIIIDPGFGFSKTLGQNYRMMRDLDAFGVFRRPLLVGISRKSMITRLLDIPVSEALNGTTALNVIALQRGASILRVHDVAAACEARAIVEALENLQ